MFRIQRHKSDRYGEKFDFRFSNLNSSQIPKGWDRLVVSLILIETGKMIAKSNKAAVHKGSCQWAESFKETIWVAQEDASKEADDGHVKLVISMGSPRSNVLGEAILNLTGYVKTNEVATVLLPLKRCTYGTMLQLQVQGTIAKTGFRDGLRKHLRELRSHNENQIGDTDDLDSRSDESDNRNNRSVGSSSSNYLGGSPHHEEPGNRELSISAAGSLLSSDSLENFAVRANVGCSSGGVSNVIGREDSISPQSSASNGVGYGDEISRSNNSSFNSKASGFQWQEGQNSSNSLGVWHMDSSKELLEAAQETIEELRGEARMWEKTARKLKNDLEALRKELFDQTNHLGELDKELLVACSERDKLKAELEQLKISSDELAVKQVTFDSSSPQKEDMLHKLMELEEEVKFQKESNATLTCQLEKTQESNYELLSILQELEETIEKQKVELANSSVQTPGSDDQGIHCENPMVLESEGPSKQIAKEEKPATLPTKCSELQSLEAVDVDLFKEVEALRAKVGELERDCAELTEENIELLYKLKAFKKDAIKNESIGSHSNLFHYGISQGHDKTYQSEEITDNLLVIQFQELEKKCASLETDLQFFKDEAREQSVNLQMTQLQVEEKDIEIDELRQKLEKHQQFEQVSSDDTPRKTEPVDTLNLTEMSVLLSEMYKELQKPISRVKNPWFENDAYVVTESGTSINISCAAVEEKAEAILCDIIKLDKLLGEKISDCTSLFQSECMDACDRNYIIQGQLEDPIAIGNMKMNSHSNCRNIAPDTVDDNSLYGDSVSSSVLKEEIAALKKDNRKLEDLICQLNSEKTKLVEDTEIALREHSIASKSLDGVKQELVQLTSRMETQVSANKILERKFLESASGKHELEINLSELEPENIHLSERISGLEAQLRYMTDEKEPNRLELENLKSLSINLKNEISNFKSELETQKSEVKQKLQETHKRFLEAQDESEFLKRSHSKLEATIEHLIDETSLLQKLNGDLRNQKLNLHDKCTLLEIELSKSHERNSEFVEKVNSLESKFVYLQKDIALKEKSLISQLEILCQESKDQEEKLLKEHIMIKKMDSEKMDEVENLQREIAFLTAQISANGEEKDRIGSDTVRELSTLRAGKSKLENSIQELLSKAQSYQTDIDNIRNESENKLQGMIGLLNASKQSEEMLMADMEHMRKLLEENKCKEEKLKRTANELELKLKTLEYEKELLKGDISSMKLQLQKIPQLQEEIISLKNSIDTAKFEKAKVEETLQLLSGECDDLKAEKKLYMEKITTMQKALSNGEDARVNKLALEEKLLRLECDLNAREALSVHDAELKNEVNRMKRTKSQYQRKIQTLEEEKDELARKVQDLIEMTKSKEDDKQPIWQEDICMNEGSGSSDRTKGADVEPTIQKLQKELEEALKTNEMYQKEPENIQAARQRTCSNDAANAPVEDDNGSTLSSLVAELKEIRERYSEMSLKYAEVEAEREELILKLKSSKSQKRWF